ncbi:MAG: ATP-binding protein [Phycisphaerae bacterium]|nr:ATP-binding protein [Phycisphaerae bacterium]
MDKAEENEFKSTIFAISQVPDVNFSQFQAAADGDVRKTIWQSFEHIARAFSNIRADQSAAEILYIYNPSTKLANKQDRLKLYLKLYAKKSQKLKNLERLLTGSMLGRFYEFEKVSKFFFEPKGLESSCSIIRREDFVQPLHNSMFNAKIPACYYTISPFEPNQKNDFLTLDRVLDKVDEPVVVKIKIQPANVSEQLHAHTGYLAHLGSINRSWDEEYEPCGSFERVDFSENKSRFANPAQALKPFTYKDPLADDIFRQQRKFHESLRKPHLRFDISITAQSDACVELLSSIIAEAAFTKGSYKIVQNNNEKLGTSKPEADYDDLRSLTKHATVDELIGAFRLLVASSRPPFCIRKNTDPKFIDPKDLILLGHDDYGIPRGIALNVLKKHLSSLGLPGAGKTTTNFNIMLQLWEKGIPFLVIESAKTEYRAIKKFFDHTDPSIRKLAKDTQIFVAGGQTSPLAINPLKKLEGISVNEHIENTLACFKAVLPVSCGSLPSLLSEAMERIYEKYPDRNKPPVMSDLIAVVQDVLESKGYSANTRSDMQTVIEVRLGVLTQLLIGEVFRHRNGLDIEELMKHPGIIELDKLTTEKKCLLTLFIFNLIRTILKTSPNYKGPLRYAIIIEEAHNIFGSSTNSVASEQIADPKSQLSDFLYQMMVELRALGVAIILSDQHPSALDSGALKTPASKLAFLQVHNEDREQLGSSMLFDGIQMQDIARLEPGHAFFFTQGYHYPQKIKTINLHEKLDISTILDDTQLCKIILDQKWFKEAQIRKISDELDQFKDHMDSFDEKRSATIAQIKKLITQREKIAKLAKTQATSEGLNTIIKKLRVIKNKLCANYQELVKHTEKKFRHLLDADLLPDEALGEYAESLFNRFDKTMKPCTEKLISFISIGIKKSIRLKFKEQSNG